jgi:hypothetical protein
MLILAYPPSASEVSAEAAAAGGGALGSARPRDFKLSNRKMFCFEITQIRMQTYLTEWKKVFLPTRFHAVVLYFYPIGF